MGIVNRRNAVVGWLAIKIGKRAAKSKAKSAVPSAKTGGIVAGIASAAAAIAGALFFWRKRSGGDDTRS